MNKIILVISLLLTGCSISVQPRIHGGYEYGEAVTLPDGRKGYVGGGTPGNMHVVYQDDLGVLHTTRVPYGAVNSGVIQHAK